MNYAFINTLIKPGILRIKPKIYKFKTGHNLYVFPGKCSDKKLKKAIEKHSSFLIPERCTDALKNSVYCKAILQALKENNLSEIFFCFENPMKKIEILTYFFNHDIRFSLTPSENSDAAADYFLEKYGLPVTIVSKVNNGLLVYEKGILPPVENTALLLDLSGGLASPKLGISEYILKEESFPIKITSLSLLETALTLTGLDVKDIIIKLCIIRTKHE